MTVELLLNSKQAQALSDFFLDIAKAVIIGAFGFSAVLSDTPFILRVTNLIGGVVLAYICIKLALSLLEE